MLAPLLILLFLSFLPLLFLLKPKTRAVLNLPPSPPKLPSIGNLHQFGSQTTKEVLKTHDIVCCGTLHTHGQKRISYNLFEVAFSPYGEYWREMCKMCVLELFTDKRVESFSYIREAEVACLISSISQISPGPIKLRERIVSLINTIICRIAFGQSYEWRQIENGEFLDAIDEAKAMVHSFWFGDFIPYVGRISDVFMGLHKRLEKCIGSFDAFFERVIADHLDPSRLRAEHEDIIDVMLRLLRDQNSSIRLTNDHIKPCLS